MIDKILQSKSALEGERKQVTVLFADVKGSMELAEQLDPEEWHKILDHFFQILTDGVHRFEGTVNQYTGDGIMALFGAPIAHEDHAQRACHAALRLRDELRRYAQRLRLDRGLDFSARMGLNTGEVVVGRIGDDLRMDYTAQGHTVSLAARMEQIAEPGSVYVTEHTGVQVRGYFKLSDLGLSQVKGSSGSLRVFALEDVGAIRTRFDVSRSRGLSRFVGRDDEMAILERALTRAESGHDSIVGIVADVGTGKSRLIHEFLQECRKRGAIVAVGHCVPHGQSVPFVPYFEIMRNYYGITDADSSEACQDKIIGRMLRLDPDLAGAVPLMLDFLGVPDPCQPVAEMTPEARVRRLAELLHLQRRARARGSAFVLVFEDMHWMDPSSHALLEESWRRFGETATLAIMTFRPEYRPNPVLPALYEQITLRPLDSGSIRSLLETLLGPAAVGQGVAELIHARTGGNPFFIEETVESLIENGFLAGARGAYHVTRPIEDLVVPHTVQAVLATRIDRLQGVAKGVLQTAAVIDKTFPVTVLRQVAGLPDREVDYALRVLAEAAFVYEEALRPDLQYAFKHPLTQEVAYGSLLKEKRQLIHRELASVLEAHHADKLDEKAALIAHHHEQGGELHEAARWHARAARWIGVNDCSAAYAHWRQTMELGDAARGLTTAEEAIRYARKGGARTPECRARVARLRALRIARGSAARPQLEQGFAEAEALVRETGALRWLPWLHTERAALAGAAGDERARDRELREAYRLFVEMGATGHAERVAKGISL